MRSLATTFGSCLLLGCVTVDPEPEEQRAWDAVTAATGVDPSAAVEPVGDALTLDEATRRAITTHPEIAAAFKEIGIAKADWVGSGLPSNPVLSLATFFPSGGGSAGMEGGLAWKFLDLWMIPTRRDAAAARLRATVLRVAALASDRVHETRVLYYEALASAERLVLYEKEEALRAETLGQISTQRDSGRASAWEVSVAESARLHASLAVLEAGRDARRARRALGERIGAPLAEAVHLTTPLPETAGPASPPLDATALVEASLESRLELRVLREEIEAAVAGEALAGTSWLKSASLGIAGERADRPSGNPDRGPSRFGPSLAVPLPIFDRGEAASASALYRRKQLELRLAAATTRVEREILDALDALETARRATAFARDSLVPATTRRLSYSRAAYDAGSVGITDVTLAERDRLDTLHLALRARLEAAIAEADLAHAVGTSD